MTRDGQDDDADIVGSLPVAHENIVPETDAATEASFPPANTLARITAWDEWCRTDYVRNSIVIPHIKQLIEDAPPEIITDLGCGSGYIARTLIRSSFAAATHWQLVDSNKTALTYAHDSVASLTRTDSFHVDITHRLPKTQIPLADLAFMAFTLLEFRLTPMTAANLENLVRIDGILSIVVPDSLWDVYTCGLGLDTIREYLHGYAVLKKRDSLTGSFYRFHANRIELLLQFLTSAGFSLINLTIHQRPGREAGDSILILDFRKTRG